MELLCKASTVVFESLGCHKPLKGIYLNLLHIVTKSTGLKAPCPVAAGNTTSLQEFLRGLHRALQRVAKENLSAIYRQTRHLRSVRASVSKSTPPTITFFSNADSFSNKGKFHSTSHKPYTATLRQPGSHRVPHFFIVDFQTSSCLLSGPNTVSNVKVLGGSLDESVL
ncbi:Interleukin-4-like protein [Aix galericulata]|nr:Interleukin-4-like protein [Aix galericulata]